MLDECKIPWGPYPCEREATDGYVHLLHQEEPKLPALEAQARGGGHQGDPHLCPGQEHPGVSRHPSGGSQEVEAERRRADRGPVVQVGARADQLCEQQGRDERGVLDPQRVGGHATTNPAG